MEIQKEFLKTYVEPMIFMIGLLGAQKDCCPIGQVTSKF